jgi:hypothetical protein
MIRATIDTEFRTSEQGPALSAVVGIASGRVTLRFDAVARGDPIALTPGEARMLAHALIGASDSLGLKSGGGYR